MLSALMQRFDGERTTVQDRNDLPETIALLAILSTLVSCALAMTWGLAGVGIAAMLAALFWLIGERMRPEILMQLYRAEWIDPSRGGPILDSLRELSRRAELQQIPAFYVIPSATLTAFSAGRGTSGVNTVIAVSEGLYRQLSMRELAGVLAHEIAHIRAGHLQIFTLADVLTRIAQLLAYGAIALTIVNLVWLIAGDTLIAWPTIILLYLTPLVMNALQSRFSRAREFEADQLAAVLSGDAMGLASAISRSEGLAGRVWEDLLPPVPGRRIPFPSLIRSHPGQRERIDKLLADVKNGNEAGVYPPLKTDEEPMVSLTGFGPMAMRPRLRWPGIWF